MIYLILFSVVLPAVSLTVPNLPSGVLIALGIGMGVCTFIITGVITGRLTPGAGKERPRIKVTKETRTAEKSYDAHYRAANKDIEKLKAGDLHDEDRQLIMGRVVKTLAALCADELNVIKSWNLPFDGQFADRLGGLEVQLKSDTTQLIPWLTSLKRFLSDFDEALCKMLSTQLGKEMNKGESIVVAISDLVDRVLMYH